MSRWFAAPAGLALDGGYFYLCPACFDECIQPRWELILDGLLEHQRPPQAAPRTAEAHTEAPAALPEATSPALPEPEPEIESGPQAAD